MAALAVALVAAGFQAFPVLKQELSSTVDCDAPTGLTRLRDVQARASTTLAPEGRFNYEAANLTDGDITTAWIPTGGDGGVGAQVVLSLPVPTEVELLCIVNGYPQNEEVYQANGRVRDVTVSTDAGADTGALGNRSPETADNFQQAPLVSGTTQTVTITINGYYAGIVSPGQDARDTAIAEIALYSDDD